MTLKRVTWARTAIFFSELSFFFGGEGEVEWGEEFSNHCLILQCLPIVMKRIATPLAPRSRALLQMIVNVRL